MHRRSIAASTPAALPLPWRSNAMTANAMPSIVHTPAASPSMPSLKLTTFISATSQMTVSHPPSCGSCRLPMNGSVTSLTTAPPATAIAAAAIWPASFRTGFRSKMSSSAPTQAITSAPARIDPRLHRPGGAVPAAGGVIEGDLRRHPDGCRDEDAHEDRETAQPRGRPLRKPPLGRLVDGAHASREPRRERRQHRRDGHRDEECKHGVPVPRRSGISGDLVHGVHIACQPPPTERRTPVAAEVATGSSAIGIGFSREGRCGRRISRATALDPGRAAALRPPGTLRSVAGARTASPGPGDAQPAPARATHNQPRPGRPQRAPGGDAQPAPARARAARGVGTDKPPRRTPICPKSVDFRALTDDPRPRAADCPFEHGPARCGACTGKARGRLSGACRRRSRRGPPSASARARRSPPPPASRAAQRRCWACRIRASAGS